MIQLGNAWPDGFQSGKQDACPSGTVCITNGGGCGPSGLASTVYVGPYALATGTGVTGSARIQDHAQVIGGKVTDSTVGALTILGSAFSVTGAATKAMTTFYPLDFFEGRTLSGGSLIGDVELRASISSGTCSGFVDASTCVAPGTDATPAPPYAWRYPESTRTRSGANRSGLGVRFYRPRGREVACASPEKLATPARRTASTTHECTTRPS
jgi:hypothetical protein